MSGTELEYSERQAVVGAARARLYLILTAVGYSTMGGAFKFVDWNPLVISAAEKMFAFFCLGIARGSFKMRFSRPVLLGAVCSYACTTCFVAANKLTTAANAIVLQYTNPMFVVLLSWLVLRRRAQRRDILLTAVLMGGIALFFLDELSPGHLVGNLLALCSGILMAVNTLYARYSGADVIEYGMVSCLLSVGIGAAAVITEPPVVTAVSLVAVVFLGVISTGIPMILFAKAAPCTPPVETSILLMLDPVLNPLLVALLVGEVPGPWALVGAAVVLGGVAAWCWNGRPKKNGKESA